MRFPAPEATFFGDFLFCQKRKLLASTRQVDSTHGVEEESCERSGGGLALKARVFSQSNATEEEYLRFALLLLLLLRRGEPLARGAVTFFSGKKESNQRKLPWERGVAGRYNGTSFRCATSRPRLDVVIAFVRCERSRFGTSAHQKLHALPSDMLDQTLPYDLGENTAWCAIVRTAERQAMVVVGGGREIGQLGSFAGINPGNRSGAKLYFPKKPYSGIRSNEADGRA